MGYAPAHRILIGLALLLAACTPASTPSSAPPTVAPTGEQPHPDLPSVPMFRDLATTDAQRQVVRFGIDAPAVFNRPFAVAPEVPADRVAALRQAFVDTLNDPAFLDDAQKAKLAIAPISGERIAGLVQELFAMPPEIKATLQGVMLVKG